MPINDVAAFTRPDIRPDGRPDLARADGEARGLETRPQPTTAQEGPTPAPATVQPPTPVVVEISPAARNAFQASEPDANAVTPPVAENAVTPAPVAPPTPEVAPPAEPAAAAAPQAPAQPQSQEPSAQTQQAAGRETAEQILGTNLGNNVDELI